MNVTRLRTQALADARRVAALAALLAVAACTVGPDFRQPDSIAAPRYLPAAPPAAMSASGTTQHFVAADDIRADWWALFAAPKLDTAIRDTLAGSPTLEQARAALERAQQERNAAANVAVWPSATARLGIERQQIDPAIMGFPQAPKTGPFTLYDVGVDVSYTFDVFGGTRRQLEGLAADIDYRRFELEAAQRTLAANVVTTALRQASLAAQIDTLERIAAAQRDALAIAQKRFDLGAIAEVELANQRALVAQSVARLPPLRAQLAATAHLLAIYAGREPSRVNATPFTLAEFTLPPDIPLTLPSQLAQRRPDIRASEALLRRASADVGVATANLYPKIGLSGSASSAHTALHQITDGINVWSIGLDLLQPVLRGPELQARKRAAIATFDGARAAYRECVLHALQNVADAMRAIEADAQTLAASDEQAQASVRVWDITRHRYRLGGVSQIALLDAERIRLEAALARDQAAAARLADTAALLNALGGGWWEVAK